MPLSTLRLVERRLREAFPQAHIVLRDNSALHAGHQGLREHGGGHFHLRIIDAQFHGLSRIRRHQLIYAALGELFQDTIHALSIQALSPAEADRAMPDPT
ncbi:MAG: BolA family transcriptional regulator [Zetaproteobacteria bacterium]|nr:MAG: BolA family transcriptional regulator [Zetaproteobacteria bacterium]